MASPDITPYSDLTIFDKQPDQIYDDQIEYARSVLPEWTPAAGSVEDAILQAASGVTGELLAALNRVPSSVLEALLKLFGIERITGTPPIASIRVDFIDNQQTVIPAGTRFGWLDNSTTDPQLYVFETEQEYTALAQDSYVVLEAVGILRERYPDLDENTPIRLLSNISYVVSAALETDLNAGQDSETDQAYFTRAISILRSYSDALVLPHQFESYILSQYTNVFRAKAFSRINPGGTDENVSNTPTRTNGRLTVYACGLNGASLSTQAASAIVEDVNAKCIAGLIVNIVPPYLVPINVATDVVIKSGFNGNEVASAVTAKLQEILSPNTWNWDTTIFYNELIVAIDSVSGVERVADLTISAPSGASVIAGTSNLRFDKYGSLPSAGSVNVTVQLQ